MAEVGAAGELETVGEGEVGGGVLVDEAEDAVAAEAELCAGEFGGLEASVDCTPG